MNAESLMQYEALIAIALGIFLCLFGYRIKKVAFTVIWFIIGYYLASLAMPYITDDQTWQLLAPIGVGIITGMLGFRIEKFCIFAVATFTVTTTIIETFQLQDIWAIALAIAAGIVVGCIATALIKPVGIITTALSGSKLIAKYSVAELALAHYPSFVIILCIGAAIGMFFQFKNCKHIE